MFLVISVFFLGSLSDSKPIGEIVYGYTSSDYFSIYGLSGEATLYFNQQKSFYKSNTVPIREEIIEEGMNITLKRGDKYGFPILTDFKNKEIISRIPFSDEKATLHETLPKMDWNLVNDTTKIIEGINCLFAHGVFESKDYHVWYTLDIPISTGPNKLGGLPGLILEAHNDENNEHYFVKSITLSEDIDFSMEFPAKADYLFNNLCEYLTEKKIDREKINKEYISKGEQPIDWGRFDIESNNIKMLEYEQNCQ